MNYEFIPVFINMKSVRDYYFGIDYTSSIGNINIEDCNISYQDDYEKKVNHPVFGECIIYDFEMGTHSEYYALKI